MKEKKHKQNNFKRKLIKKIFIILIIFFALNIYFKLASNSNNIITNLSSSISRKEKFKVIKQDQNENYSGIGQTKIKNKDGYFTTFTTKYNKTYIEYKQNGTSSWAKNEYWGGTMDENGCRNNLSFYYFKRIWNRRNS